MVEQLVHSSQGATKRPGNLYCSIEGKRTVLDIGTQNEFSETAGRKRPYGRKHKGEDLDHNPETIATYDTEVTPAF